MGDSEGPILHDDKSLADVAARVIDVQLRQVAGRTRARPYTEEANVLKDEKETLMSPEDAIIRLERGSTI
jgi:hypothetical protein